jgi:hypothetical protein
MRWTTSPPAGRDVTAPRETATASLFDRLFALSREAHALGQHEVAYHALTAAMHAADDAADAAALERVGREAEAQIAAIDRTEPAHRLSTRSASHHGHPGVYVMLVRQAAMHVRHHEARTAEDIWPRGASRRAAGDEG